MHRFLAAILLLLTMTSQLYAQMTSDYLILQDIGPYKLDRPEKLLPGRPPTGGPEIYANSPGVVGPADHFSIDHADTTYSVMYIGGNGIPSPTVMVTDHTDPVDSRKWLLHEVDKEFRTYYGIPDPSYIIKTIDGNTIYTFGTAGWDYRWISGNEVIMIEYHDTQMVKPEPLEVVRAYLVKHPSTLPAITMKELYSNSNKTTWIKDEMDRRLWLCDKWFYQLQLGKVQQNQVYQESVKSMNIFLDYREKYYRVKAEDGKNILSKYLMENNGTGVKAKLKEYKDWWTAHKGDSISIQ